ncbi:MAG: TVP38/TMEM64 family protein [Deltaproteobacteria bacterium]|nr:TVP38/TMEM64 family protein [Deltaproteobacteria bacterium]
MTRKRITRLGGVVLLLLAVAVLVQETGLSLGCALAEVEELRGAGPTGVAAFLGAYAVGTWAMLPASWFQGASGFLYGAGPGIGVAWLASTAFGALSFELTRGQLRDRVAGWMRARDGGRFEAIDRMIARRGLVAVILLRLSPLAPYNVVNYLLGLTAVSRGTYLLGTALGGLVPVVVYGLLGSAVSDLAAMNDAGRGNPAAAAAVIGTTVVASLGLALFVKRALGADPPHPPEQALSEA